MNAPSTRLLAPCLIATIPELLAAQNPAPRETVLNPVSVIDMAGRAIQTDMAVLIRGDRIAAIERSAGLNVAGARVMDLRRRRSRVTTAVCELFAYFGR